MSEAKQEPAALPASPHLEGLNREQREAVESLDGPVLVLAGAGTGKTRVLTTRLVQLLRSGKARPFEILAVTFTNKAAREMRDRVGALLGRPVEGWWLGTFHSLAARILRDNAERLDLQRNFTILDTDDQLRLLKQILEAENIDAKRWPARSILWAIERWKDRGLTPDKVSAAEVGDIAGGRAVEIYKAYQARLKALNACDFGDLLLHNLTLFQEHKDILPAYHRQFRYLLVDEYQDTNVAQYLWLRLLAQAERNICCVGDDDQSIYGWRGAEVGNILRFETDFPGAKVIRLERNYRSTPNILAAASAVIANNESRLGKTLFTDTSSDPGEPVRVRGLWDGEAEARFVGEEIEALQRKGHKLSEIAILVRTGAQTREFEERFITLGLPYRVVGGPRFYERREIRDALAYLRIIASPSDDLAFERIVNVPKRGIGDATLRILHAAARASGKSLMEATAELVQTDELRPAPRRALGDLVANFGRWRGLTQDLPQAELAEIVLDESGYTAMWQADLSAEAPGRLENLKELVSAMTEFESLAGFLEHVSLVMETLQGEGQDLVTVMTLHAAKGLEFDSVFLAGWEDGLFPNQRALDESGLKGLEEERRLAYVGLTRARQRAFVSFAANRRLHGSWASSIPSRFVDELPRDSVEVESDAGLYGAAQGGFGPSGFSEWEPQRWSPGMARAQQHRAETNRFIEGTAKVAKQDGGSYQEGDRIFHRKYGYGTVMLVEGDRLTVEFDKGDTKHAFAGFVVPAHLAG